MDILLQRERLNMLEDGWFGKDSLAPSPRVLEWLDAHMSIIYSISTASLIPITDGSVAIGWVEGNLDVTVEIRPDETLFFLTDNVETDELEEETVPYSTKEFIGFVVAYSTGF